MITLFQFELGEFVKKIWVIFMLMNISSTTFAGGLSSKCVKRLLNFRTSIIESADMVDYYHNISVTEGHEGYSKKQLADAEILRDGMRLLRTTRQFSDRQILIITKVCNQKNYNGDAISLVIETLN